MDESTDLTERLLDLSQGYLRTASLHAAAELRLADLLAGGPRGAEDLAAEAGLDAPYLARLLRYLAAYGVFRQEDDGRFALTPLAQLLRSDVPGSMRSYVEMHGHDIFVRSATGLSEAVRTGGNPFEAEFGMPFYQYLFGNRELGMQFDASMASFSEALSDQVAGAYDFGSARSVVDVGGGRGGQLLAILRRNPHLEGTLMDREPVVAGHVLDVPELAGRWRAVGGDFFAAVPEGGDVYILKHVLASWPDDQCVRILEVCRDAMPDGGRMLMVNALVPEGNEPHPAKDVDMVMLTVLNGRGRTQAEYEDLMRKAGLVPGQVLHVSQHAAIIEATKA
ncbi:acetylserotonin O-methyltransferase [Streptomyces sp. NBC_01808]|uniref:methyltransferase n=1 Tax=Streptomyces sp. NBC_01808 TaxID=2975947 RepID=UPI002DDBFCFA|nr:methyltransferase [Streptomyces sp. NBC_01808]WSA41741.1 acetylserotonin O-methyltransferase [Streptomyces sp. NBC_01808]